MVVIVTENALPKLRGRLAVYLLEIRAGVYVGRADQKTREMLWSQVTALLGNGNAIMAWSVNREGGFDFITAGESRRFPVDNFGVPLVAFAPEPER